MKKTLCVLSLSLVPSAAMGASSVQISPALLEAVDGQGPTLALEYSLNGTLLKRALGQNDSGSEDLNPDVSFGSLAIGYKGSGTVAASKLKNPKDFLDLLVDGKYRYSSAVIGTMEAGGFAKYEADQDFKNKQSVVGLRGTWGKFQALARNDFVAIDLNYGRVDPSKDEARIAVVGNKDSYYRWDAEFLYMYPTGWRPVETLEFNYRYYKERNAPAAIRATGLDRHHLGTVRLGLPNEFFIAYSQGKLPFDKSAEKIFELGISYKLK